MNEFWHSVLLSSGCTIGFVLLIVLLLFINKRTSFFEGRMGCVGLIILAFGLIFLWTSWSGTVRSWHVTRREVGSQLSEAATILEMDKFPRNSSNSIVMFATDSSFGAGGMADIRSADGAKNYTLTLIDGVGAIILPAGEYALTQLRSESTTSSNIGGGKTEYRSTKTSLPVGMRFLVAPDKLAYLGKLTVKESFPHAMSYYTYGATNSSNASVHWDSDIKQLRSITEHRHADWWAMITKWERHKKLVLR